MQKPCHQYSIYTSMHWLIIVVNFDFIVKNIDTLGKNAYAYFKF